MVVPMVIPMLLIPQVLYTRTWSKVEPEASDLEPGDAGPLASASSTTVPLPICTSGFADLCEALHTQLADLAGATDREGRPSLNFGPTYGQLELIAAQVTSLVTAKS